MQKNIKLFFLLCLIILSCKVENKEKISKRVENSSSADTCSCFVLNNFVMGDSINIQKSTAVIFQPNENRIKMLKKENEEDFYIVADDNLYYISQLRKILMSYDINVIETDSIHIKLIYAKNKKCFIDRSKQDWGFILVEVNKCPEIRDLNCDEEDIKQYFEIKK